ASTAGGFPESGFREWEPVGAAAPGLPVADRRRCAASQGGQSLHSAAPRSRANRGAPASIRHGGGADTGGSVALAGNVGCAGRDNAARARAEKLWRTAIPG